MGNRAARNGVVKDYFDTVPILIRRGRMSRGFENIWRFLNADRTGGWGWAGTACRWQMGRISPNGKETIIVLLQASFISAMCLYSENFFEFS